MIAELYNAPPHNYQSAKAEEALTSAEALIITTIAVRIAGDSFGQAAMISASSGD